MNKFYQYILNYTDRKIITHLDVTICLFIISWIITTKIKVSTDLFYLIFTLLIWCGLGFIILVTLMQHLNNHTQGKLKRVSVLVLGCFALIVFFAGPIILYLLAKEII